MATVVHGDFEWDADKATANVEKHGVTFEEAATVLSCPITAERPDPTDPANVITIGFSLQANVLLVVSTERKDRTRIISARKATAQERKAFGQG